MRPCGKMLALSSPLRFDPNQTCALPRSPPSRHHPVITDPWFALLAIVAVILQGLSKGGFLGLGLMSLPLMSLSLPPMQAAAIILPTVLAQDALTVWIYRRSWSAR